MCIRKVFNLFLSILIGSICSVSSMYAGENSSGSTGQGVGAQLLQGSNTIGKGLEQGGKAANTQPLKASRTFGQWLEDVTRKANSSISGTGKSGRESSK